MNPKYPVYIISKGRHDTRLTSKALERIGVPYSIVIEPQEYKKYSEVIDSSKILILPFSDLGMGSIPARNWVWDHSISIGAKWHWIMDDNIRCFYRFNHNLKVPVSSGNIFRCVEDFVERYENIGQAGLNYFMFVSRKTKPPPYYLNTRIYSCILNRNDHNHRWRGRYNEDTDLSLRILKDYDSGWCTVLFNAFLCEKMQTMTMSGGNTEELYLIKDGRLKMAQSLVDQHPDIATITEKWGRYQHQVDYSAFKNKKLKRKPNFRNYPKIDNFNMIFQENINGEWVNI